MKKFFLNIFALLTLISTSGAVSAFADVIEPDPADVGSLPTVNLLMVATLLVILLVVVTLFFLLRKKRK